MTLFESLAVGIGNVLSWPGVLIPVAGTLMAMVVSFLPGIGSASLMAVMLVLTLSWEPESVLLLFGALTGGATFMGSITGILFNIPGGAPSAAVLMDGYPLGRQGYPRMAIACAATASAVGSIFGVVVLVALLPVVRPFLLEFGPVERLLLGIWGLTTIVAVPNTPPLRSAAMAVLGLLTAMVGTEPGSGDPRWTFGIDALREGFGVVPVLLGLFTLAELVSWTQGYRVAAAADACSAPARDSVRAGIRAVFRHPGLVLRSSVIGTLVGIVPGVGGTVAGFIAYGQAVQSAREDRSRFGKGDIRGVIAPEAAVDAKDGGSLLPAVAFGLPGSEAGVMLVSVFAVHGLVPGAPMLTEQMPMTMTLVMALLFSNLLTSVVGVLATPWLARLTALRVDRIALPALLVSLLAVVQVNASLTDLHVAAAFGIAGYFFKRYGWPRVPFVIAFVLGEFLESNLTLSLRLLELGRVEPFQRPATLTILALTVASMVWMYRKTQSGEAPAAPARRGAMIADGHRAMFWLLALVPFGAEALGLPTALGGLVFAHMLMGTRRLAVRVSIGVAAGCATALAADYLIQEVANLILPRGWVWDLVAPMIRS